MPTAHLSAINLPTFSGKLKSGGGGGGTSNSAIKMCESP